MTVVLGLEKLINEKAELVNGCRAALLTHQAAVDWRGETRP